MNPYLKEWTILTLAAMAGEMPTEIEAIEQSVIRVERKAELARQREYCEHCLSDIEPDDLHWRNGLPYCGGCYE